MSIRKRTRRYQHGSLTESPDGKRWIVKYYPAPGKQTTKTLGRKKDITRKQAEQMRDDLIKPLNQKPFAHLGEETFERFVEDVFFPMKLDTDWRENTAKESMREIRKHLIPYLGEVKFADITAALLRAFLKAKAELCVRKRKFIVTTESNHGKKIYPNLARKIVLTDVDQLWVADITYIRLREEFVFLAVILDAYSRRVIGWALERTIEDDLTLQALRMALAQRVIEPGLVHHSDRGSQYASGDYTDLLKQNGIEVSMSRKGNPWDNAACESFMKTLKYEEVHRNEYRNLNEARSTIRVFLEKVYKQKRLHSAIGYVPPAEFEAKLLTQQKEAAARQLTG